MQTLSPVFAALGVIEFDALNDLACWLDGGAEPTRSAGQSGWPTPSGERAGRVAGRSSGREA